MHIEVARIPPEGQNMAGSDEAVMSGEEKLECEPLGPVNYSFHVNYVSHELIVTGTLELDARFSCSRCARPIERKVREPRFECIFEAPEGTESVDLTGEMREAILCAFPSYPVCRNDCRGLCAHCGKDLNEGECGCSPTEGNRWDALSGLKLK